MDVQRQRARIPVSTLTYVRYDEKPMQVFKQRFSQNALKLAM